MKKLFTILLALAMAASLAACSGGEKTTESQPADSGNITAETTDTSETAGNPLAQYIVSESPDTTIIDLRNASVYDGMLFFENDQYSLSFGKVPQYSADKVRISIDLVITNKTNDVIYESKYSMDKPINPGESKEKLFGLYPEQQEKEDEVKIFEAPVDKDGNPLRQVMVYCSLGATNKNIDKVILDNEFVTVTYNTIDEYGSIICTLVAKEGTNLNDDLQKPLVPGEVREKRGTKSDEANGIGHIRVTYYDLNDSKVVEKLGNDTDRYANMNYRHDIYFNIADGTVVNVETTSQYI